MPDRRAPTDFWLDPMKRITWLGSQNEARRVCSSATVGRLPSRRRSGARSSHCADGGRVDGNLRLRSRQLDDEDAGPARDDGSPPQDRAFYGQLEGAQEVMAVERRGWGWGGRHV